MFDDDDDSLGLGPMPSLFGPVPAILTSLPTLAPPSPASLSSFASVPTSSVSYLPSPSTPSFASPHPTKPLRKPSAARATTALVDLAAPVAPRTYLLPSSTSRKRKTSLVERELAKRQCVRTDTGEQAADVPEELVAAVERHRALNTLSARKSRLRKKQQVDDLEADNARLVGETDVLKARVAQLEAMLRSVVKLPPV